MKYIVHMPKFTVSAICCIVFAGIGGFCFFPGKWREGIVFAAFAVIYGVIAVMTGSSLYIGGKYLEQRFLGIRIRSLAWQDVKEVGVVGTKVFNKGNPDKTGSLYIYFSPAVMDDDERFQMCVRWPPKKAMYMQYTHKRITAVQSLWDKPLELFNVGSLEIQTKES